MIDILMKIKAIFRDFEYFSVTDSFNPRAAQTFDDNAEEFYNLVQKDCERSITEFDNHYEGCPYKHKNQEIPDDVLKI